jgi:FdhD protein
VSVVVRSVWRDGVATDDAVAVEEPLEIRVEGEPLAVTMRTPGDDLDLAAGFLYSELVIDGADDLVALAEVGENTVDARLAGGVGFKRDAIAGATRALYATSSCGICGIASIDRLRKAVPAIARRLELPDAAIAGLPDALRAGQPAFARTGGVHAAGLADASGAIELVREDVGRHNAVDKVLGARLRADRVPVDDRALVVTSRAGFEIVQKALVARISVVVAVGAPTSLAIELAESAGIALYGFVREGRFNRYTP